MTTATPPRPLVLAKPAPAPLEVVARWLRAKARLGLLCRVPIVISPHLAVRLAAVIEEKRG